MLGALMGARPPLNIATATGDCRKDRTHLVTAMFEGVKHVLEEIEEDIPKGIEGALDTIDGAYEALRRFDCENDLRHFTSSSHRLSESKP